MDRFLSAHLADVSRTYAIVIPMLPSPLDGVVGLAYLVMRAVDTIEDDPQLSEDERCALLAELKQALQQGAVVTPSTLQRPLGVNVAEQRLMTDLDEILQRVAGLPDAQRAALVKCAATMSDGVIALTRRAAQRSKAYPAIESIQELREYCYYVAGVVGEMLCALMADDLRQPNLLKLRDVAVELGIGLQLVNILKDCVSDAEVGRRYLPLVDDARESASVVYNNVLTEARGSLRRGVDFVMALPTAASGMRFFCGLPIAWGAMTLAGTQRESVAKISRSAIQSTISRFQMLVGDDSGLQGWLRDLLVPPELPDVVPVRIAPSA